ncbi:P-loop containing nucleoside triphosphate hydrolase protein [Byssothecium circinans]|uniref:P-loop containing nucleoside triphosphate hydrolase protein n=1 Tax=Byssothecium circinans TaxID=147558 RepID=A0A6A5TWC8_9PLEO|nr:P-loop containing nucleoside triphosphate hydrolase protein [Byssothecium circinans]
MAETGNDTGPPEMGSHKGRIEELEQRYISLLEAKVARLEMQLSTESAGDEVGAEEKTGSEASINEDTFTEGQAGKQKPEEEEENELRYKIIISKWDSEAGDFKDIDATKKEGKKEIGPENQPRRAFTLRKLTMTRTRFSAQRNQSESVSSEVTIETKGLQKLLGKITHKWGWSDMVVSCRSPYIPLVHSWKEALKESQMIVEGEPEDDKKAREDLAKLLHIISTSSGYLPLDRYFKDRKTFIEERTITHSALWSLFPPGTLIVAQPFLDQQQLFFVQSCDGFVTEDRTFDLVCYCLDYDGYEFNRVPFEMQIPYWGPDQRSIIELPFYPLEYHGDGSKGEDSGVKSIEELKKKLIARGKKFFDICTTLPGKQMFKYKGDAHVHTGVSLLHRVDSTVGGRLARGQDDSSSMSTSHDALRHDAMRHQARSVNKKEIDGTTMVDFESFYEYLSPNTPILGSMQRYEGQLETLSPDRRANPVLREMYKFDWDKHKRTEPMTPEQHMLCPPRVLGYALKQKKWAQLLVSKLQPPDKADASTFQEKLQLDDELKELVQKSVQAHERGKERDWKGRPLALQDFAPDKGKGLIIMLYGYPGVGKTLTAESVALMAGKPLLSVGVSDIGIEGDKVEANLQKIFYLAGKWEAVLLFDEADVFLEARGEGENDLQRNAMVSVLLRVLEYYDGILILTTNRMKSFDIAVQSRIHIAIKYEELTAEQQSCIWESFLTQLHDKKLVDDFSDLMRWVNAYGRKQRFNGRQIRNVVSTAMGIAMMENEPGGTDDDDDHDDDGHGNGRFGNNRGNGKLKRMHIERVAKQTKDFKQDLKAQEDIYNKITR